MNESVSELSLEEEILEEEDEEEEEEREEGHTDQPLEEGEEEEGEEEDELEFPDTAVSIQSTNKEGGGVRLHVQRVDSTASVDDEKRGDDEATPPNVSKRRCLLFLLY